jgi:hypothetical protein
LLDSTIYKIPSGVTHSWLQKLRIAFVPGPSTPLLERFTGNLLGQFQENGHAILDKPQGDVDVLLTSAVFGRPINWREAMLFTARRQFHLNHVPLVFTLVHATPDQFRQSLDHFETALKKVPPDREDFVFPGMTSNAYRTLYEQGRRGGPILSLVRMVQSQSMSIRVILIVGDEEPIEAYTFDLVGAHPRSIARKDGVFYEDLMLRIVTAASTQEVTEHQVTPNQITLSDWKSLSTPNAMRVAGRELGQRDFFTEMVRVANLVSAPAIHEAVSSRYSEGCYATWDPKIDALIATITGSARPVAKDNLTDDELAVIVGLRADGLGALVREVDGKRHDPPSSEAVEMLLIDQSLPQIKLGLEWEGLTGTQEKAAPIIRSKLHGHRGVKAYNPNFVEHVYLDPPYYYYPVSCSTEAQARAITTAFARSEALLEPDDPRNIIFTVLPGHGIVITEKWVHGKEPFQLIWEAMDSGKIEIDRLVPQGQLEFVLDTRGYKVLKT